LWAETATPAADAYTRVAVYREGSVRVLVRKTAGTAAAAATKKKKRKKGEE